MSMKNIASSNTKGSYSKVVLFQIEEPEKAPVTKQFKRRRIVLGRDEQCQFHLDDKMVSKQHAEIVPMTRGLLLKDLDSLNGCYVNRKRVKRITLAKGDRIRIGKYTIVFLGVKKIRRNTEQEPFDTPRQD